LDFYTINLPPYSYVNSKIDGPFKQVAQEVCKRSGISCSFKTAPWKRIMKQVKSGEYHACFVVGKNSSRENWMYFSDPVVETEYGFFIHSKVDNGPRSYGDLSDYNIVVHQKSNTAKKLKALKRDKGHTFKIIEEIDVDTAIKKFANKRYPENTLLYGNKDIYLYLFKNLKANNVHYLFKDKPIQYRFGFSKESVSKKDFNLFNKHLNELKKSGFVSRVLEQ
jgi:polar amino acid transport system substrate-binding protein